MSDATKKQIFLNQQEEVQELIDMIIETKEYTSYLESLSSEPTKVNHLK
jgi:hypothetical protein